MTIHARILVWLRRRTDTGLTPTTIEKLSERTAQRVLALSIYGIGK